MEKKPFFKISVKTDKVFYITFLITYFFIILCECGFLPFSRQGYSLIALFFIFFSLIRFELRETFLVDLLIPIANSFLFTLVFQLMLSCDPKLLNTPTFVGNVALNAGITYLFLIMTNRVRLSVTISNFILFIFTFIDYLVISFRGSEIKISDFYSIRTAASVVGQYKIEFSSRINYSIAIFLAVLFFAWVTKITHKSRKSQLPRIVGAVYLGISLLTVSRCMNNSTNYMQLWGFEGVKYNGVTYNFLIEARDSRITEPEGFSSEKAEELLSQYESTDSEEDTPNIVVIMSEAFSDFGVLGDVKMSQDPLEYYKSLTENTVKGYALSSVYGGNTATSEWEFLTGNTQAFLPYGSVAYQQYIKNKANSIVSVMEDNGYTTVAMHPFRSTGWRRNVVYDVFGFDEKYFIDELSGHGKIRGFVSDKTLFGDITQRFENKKADEKIFAFCITMQNHGGYEYGGFEEDVFYEGGDYLSVNQYLTLLKKSDDALRELISFFENYDEKTMVVIFGDHFPSVSSGFYKEVLGEANGSFLSEMKKHSVPFMIWTNYDIEEETVELTSLNYLSTIMMKKAGIGLPPYFSYLDSLMEKIPAINFYGFYSKEKGTLVRKSEAAGKEKETMEEYRFLQYYNVFEK